MMKFGARPSQMREMTLDDIFYLRMRLLILMARDCLTDVFLTAVRRQAMLLNALHVETEAAVLGRLNTGMDNGMPAHGSIFIDDYVYRCAYDMAVQVHRIARVGKVDRAQRAVLRRKIEDIDLMRATDVFEKRFPALAAFEPYGEGTFTAALF